MTAESRISRRAMGAGLGALSLAGCAPTTIQVNLAGLQPPPADEAHLDTGADGAMRMTAPVRINGQGPFEFVVDTGANRTVISAELAKALALPEIGVTDVHGVSGVEPAATVGIDLLEVDQVSSRKLRAPALARSRLGVDGLLGVDVLKDRRVIMNFTRNQLTIGPERSMVTEPSSFDMRREGVAVASSGLGKRVVVPARYRFGQLIIIAADVSGRPVTAFVDTGSQTTVGNGALRNVVLGSPTTPRPLVIRVPVLSATGQTSEGEIGTMPVLKIGGLTITNLTAVFADLHVFDIWDLTRRSSLLLGMDVMRQFNAIELNYMRREVIFYLKADVRRGGD